MSRSASLPIINREDDVARPGSDRPLLRLVVHAFRVALLLSILLLIRFAHRDLVFAEPDLNSNTSALVFSQAALTGAASVQPNQNDNDGNRVLDRDGCCVGYLMQTSPGSDHVIGYSGPTNCLIALNQQHEIVSVQVLSSGDTVDHVEFVKQDLAFLQTFVGLGFESNAQWEQIDAVSGATLTSHAVIASIANRVSGTAPSLKFDAIPTLSKVSQLLIGATAVKPTDRASVWDVLGQDMQKIGRVLMTTPAANDLNGYQGPTAALAGFDLQGVCVGVIVDQTYDNQPYASYLDNDFPFRGLYLGKTLKEIARMTPAAADIDGVSGATMTSVAVAEGLAMAATAALRPASDLMATASGGRRIRRWQSYVIDATTVLLVLIGVAFSFTTLSKKRWLRIGYQFLVIGVLGFVSGHMLSQASVAGWSAHAVPWSVAPGLVFLSFAALLVPVVSKHQSYCQHVCPMGAVQQLTRNRVGWRLPIPKIIYRFRGLIPFVLLAVTVTVAITGSAFNLASIEPFDGFSFRVAGWATISVLIVGLLLSLVSPMAYCRFGCPTGAMLSFVRFRSNSHRLGIADVAALTLWLLAISFYFR